jgi:Zn-dependent M28 family amino/carboxypeptidase
MIGRVDEKYEGNPNYVYLIGSDRLSKDLDKLSKRTAKAYKPKMKLDYTYNHPDDPNRFYERSDHYNFAKHGIPVIFYFNGTHEDYHQPTDTVEKINFDKMEEIAQLIFLTAWEIAQRDERPKVDKK